MAFGGQFFDCPWHIPTMSMKLDGTTTLRTPEEAKKFHETKFQFDPISISTIPTAVIQRMNIPVSSSKEEPTSEDPKFVVIQDPYYDEPICEEDYQEMKEPINMDDFDDWEVIEAVVANEPIPENHTQDERILKTYWDEKTEEEKKRLQGNNPSQENIEYYTRYGTYLAPPSNDVFIQTEALERKRALTCEEAILQRKELEELRNGKQKSDTHWPNGRPKFRKDPTPAPAMVSPDLTPVHGFRTEDSMIRITPNVTLGGDMSQYFSNYAAQNQTTEQPVETIQVFRHMPRADIGTLPVSGTVVPKSDKPPLGGTAINMPPRQVDMTPQFRIPSDPLSTIMDTSSFMTNGQFDYGKVNGVRGTGLAASGIPYPTVNGYMATDKPILEAKTGRIITPMENYMRMAGIQGGNMQLAQIPNQQPKTIQITQPSEVRQNTTIISNGVLPPTILPKGNPVGTNTTTPIIQPGTTVNYNQVPQPMTYDIEAIKQKVMELYPVFMETDMTPAEVQAYNDLVDLLGLGENTNPVAANGNVIASLIEIEQSGILQRANDTVKTLFESAVQLHRANPNANLTKIHKSLIDGLASSRLLLGNETGMPETCRFVTGTLGTSLGSYAGSGMKHKALMRKRNTNGGGVLHSTPFQTPAFGNQILTNAGMVPMNGIPTPTAPPVGGMGIMRTPLQGNQMPFASNAIVPQANSMMTSSPFTAPNMVPMGGNPLAALAGTSHMPPANGFQPTGLPNGNMMNRFVPNQGVPQATGGTLIPPVNPTPQMGQPMSKQTNHMITPPQAGSVVHQQSAVTYAK